jgi:hypothetical protein
MNKPIVNINNLSVRMIVSSLNTNIAAPIWQPVFAVKHFAWLHFTPALYRIATTFLPLKIASWPFVKVVVI